MRQGRTARTGIGNPEGGIVGDSPVWLKIAVGPSSSGLAKADSGLINCAGYADVLDKRSHSALRDFTDPEDSRPHEASSGWSSPRHLARPMQEWAPRRREEKVSAKRRAQEGRHEISGDMPPARGARIPRAQLGDHSWRIRSLCHSSHCSGGYWARGLVGIVGAGKRRGGEFVGCARGVRECSNSEPSCGAVWAAGAGRSSCPALRSGMVP